MNRLQFLRACNQGPGRYRAAFDYDADGDVDDIDRAAFFPIHAAIPARS